MFYLAKNMGLKIKKKVTMVTRKSQNGILVRKTLGDTDFKTFYAYTTSPSE